MKPKKKVENTIRTKLRFTAGTTLRDRWLAEVMDAQKQTKTACRASDLRRIVTRGAAARLLSAAAVVAVVVLSITLWNRLSAPAYALSQTVEALQNIRFLHIIRHDESGRMIDQRWIEIGADGWQVRYRQDAPLAVLLHVWETGKTTLDPDEEATLVPMAVEDGQSTALYRYDKNAVILYDRRDMQFQWVGKLGKAFESLRQDGKILREDDEYQGRPAHRVWWPALHDECYVDPQTKLPLIVGDSELSYEEPPAGTFDIVSPRECVVIDRRPGAAGLLPDWFLEEESRRNNRHNYFGQARQALVGGDYAEAARLFEHAVAQGPGSNWAWFWLGSAYYGQGQYDQAVERFSRVLEMSGNRPCDYCAYARGLAYARRGLLERAQADWQACLPMMIRALRIPSAGYMFEYADNPLVSCGEYQPNEPQIIARMINRLRQISGQNFGYDPDGTPEQKEAAIVAWEQWFYGGGPIQFTPQAPLVAIPAATAPGR
jgi:tetratricopeptide (TPR) repeat protein